MTTLLPSTATDEDELAVKRSRLAPLVADGSALLLTSDASLSWLLDGARVGVSLAAAPVLCATVTATSTTVYCPANEAARLAGEELPPSVELVTVPWDRPLLAAVGAHVGPSVIPEQRVEADIRAARASLLPRELERYRRLCAETAAILTDVASKATPHLTERAVASRLAAAIVDAGADPLVILVAGESRLPFRHPLPSASPLGRRAMLVVCARRHGMIANATRWVRFATATARESDDDAAILGVEADIFAAMRPGWALDDLVTTIVESYPRHGFAADSWQQHHQGGPTGYAGRDPRLVPGLPDRLTSPQAFAWNPSAPGTKVEDTVLLTEHGVEVLTADPRWPTVSIAGCARPATLEL